MIRDKKIEFSQKSWKRINMRNVSHLLGVEFMHNLYNRHLPRINSVRFSNTIVNWKNGQVNSYAPQQEWDELARWFGRKFLKLDKRLLEQVENLLNFDRGFYNSFMHDLEGLKLKKLSRIDLGLTLIDLQEYSLGELYQVNLVQIEHALTYAVKTLLEQYEKDETKRNQLLASLVVFDIPTESQKEDIEFGKIVRMGIAKKIKNPQKNKIIFQKIEEHWKKYAFMHCAYGALPRKINFYFSRYKKFYCQKKLLKGNELIGSIAKHHKESLRLLKSLGDRKLDVLIPLMVRVGIFRDYNKAQLGQTIKYKLNILDEIARRKLERRDALNYYLLSEILILLENGKKINRKEILARKKNGVSLIRREYLRKDKTTLRKKVKGHQDSLRGTCASSGVVVGKAAVVLSKEDASKVKPGDIMIAIGTDFDLMEAIQLSSAVVTEEGGLLSHASVVCREMMKPCCIGVSDATKIIKNGMKIKVDANNGLVTLL